MSVNSWLHIRTQWTLLKHGESRAILVPYRRERLPWYGEKYIMAAIIGTDLFLIKSNLTRIQDIEGVIDLDDVIIKISPPNFSVIWIDEFVPWPAAEAIYEGYTFVDVTTSYKQQDRLYDALLQSMHRDPVLGWMPVHRGALGVSFIYNCKNGLGCLELTADALYYRRGLAMDNWSLYDCTIVKSWSIHDFNVDSITSRAGNIDDAIQARMMARRLRRDAWEWIVRNELPF